MLAPVTIGRIRPARLACKGFGKPQQHKNPVYTELSAVSITPTTIRSSTTRSHSLSTRGSEDTAGTAAVSPSNAFPFDSSPWSHRAKSPSWTESEKPVISSDVCVCVTAVGAHTLCTQWTFRNRNAGTLDVQLRIKVGSNDCAGQNWSETVFNTYNCVLVMPAVLLMRGAILNMSAWQRD